MNIQTLACFVFALSVLLRGDFQGNSALPAQQRCCLNPGRTRDNSRTLGGHSWGTKCPDDHGERFRPPATQQSGHVTQARAASVTGCPVPRSSAPHIPGVEPPELRSGTQLPICAGGCGLWAVYVVGAGGETWILYAFVRAGTTRPGGFVRPPETNAYKIQGQTP